MYKEVKAFCYNHLWKNYGILKLFFLIMCGLILLEELFVFFIEKPTLTKTIKAELTNEEYPEIIICPQPSVDLSQLRIGFNCICRNFDSFLK